MDRAFLTIASELNVTTNLLYQVDECDKCPLLFLTEIQPFPVVSTINISTIYPIQLAVRRLGSSENICRFIQYFTEACQYNLSLSAWKNNSCGLRRADSHYHDANTPIYVALGILIGFACLWQLAGWIFARWKARRALEHQFALASGSEETSVATSADSDLSRPAITRRLQSLDTFRGLTLTAMIFVNCGGGGYWFFDHSPWNGLTIADLLFPWFMLIMGVSMGLSSRSASKKSAQSRTKLFLNILRRSGLLFLFGLIINSMGYNSMEELRIPSVLGRFSVAYLAVASCQLLLIPWISRSTLAVRFPALIDVVPYWPIWLVSLIFPFAQVMLTKLLPVPGCPTGYMGPGGLHENGTHWNCTGGAAGYIDRICLGSSHIYQKPTSQPIYRSVAFDPEGILGYLSGIFIVFLGLQTGRTLTLFDEARQKLTRLVGWGLILGLIAGLLCKFSKNDGWIPVNKNLWSLSFSLASASTGILLLAVLYFIVDVHGFWSGSPFFYPSVNSIVVYVGSEILDSLFPFSWHMPNSHAAQLFMACWTTGVWLMISFLMYQQQVVIAL